jgi:hypothetical protein
MTTTSKPGKKHYETPVLSVYGDIRQVTQAVATTSTVSDGGMGATNKTA